MKILGLILEINPYHNGHQYFITEAINLVEPDITIVVVSTSFSMRGDVSLLSKFDKTELLLDSNIDIVMELPVSKTLNSADFFGYHAIDILNKMGVTDLAFGIENGKIDVLNKLHNLTNSQEFLKNLSLNSSNNKSYKTNNIETLKKITDDFELLSYYEKPNFTLALSYLKAIKEINSNIKYHAIPRIDNFYDDSSIKFKSAFTLRERIKNGQSIDEYINYNEELIKKIDYNTLYNLIKYKLTIEQSIYKSDEGIENYIKNNLADNYETFIANISNKKYTISRIKRCLISLLLNIDNSYNQYEEYYRLLGFNLKGEKYINSLDKNTKKVLKTTLKNDSSITGKIEIVSTKLYSILTNTDLLLDEYKIPIKKEKEND